MSTPIEVKHVGAVFGNDINLYCGRFKAMTPPGMVFANIGNRHKMRDHSDQERNRVCEAYAKDLEDPDHPHHRVIKHIAKRVQEGKSIGLFCHCAPKRCHCDEIRRRALIEAGSFWSNEAE